jgi:hypothetical protein
MLILNRILALVATLGLGGLICTIGIFQFVEVGKLQMLGAIGAGYVTAVLVLLANRSLVELMLMIGLLSTLAAGMIFLAGDLFTAAIQLGLWGVVCGAGYAPMLLISIGQWEAPERRHEFATRNAPRRY